MHSEAPLRALFEPRSVVVVGASRHPGKVGHTVLKNLVTSGYTGKILPVNPAGGEILGLAVCADLDEVPQDPDLAVICLPRDQARPALEALGRKGLGAAIVVASGFKETGKDGWRLEEELAATARQFGIALLGPNCLGLMNAPFGLNASFARACPEPGSVGFFSQSGALCAAILDWALGEDLGFSKFVSLGNKAVLSEAHILEALGDDPQTRVILGYCESVDNGRDLLTVAQKVTAEKPVIMIKAGATPAGARAASSHTGSVAGSPPAYEAAFRQAGILQPQDVESLFDLARAFSCQPLPQGPNLTVVTNSGGPGILAADACENSRLHLTRPSPQTLERLRSFLPSFASLYNPIDIIGDAPAERYRQTLDAVLDDELVHAVLVLLSPTASVQIEDTARAIVETSAGRGKPVFACFMGGLRIGPGRDILLNAGVPCYGFPEPAIRAMEAMYSYQSWQNRSYPVEVCFRRDKGRAETILKAARATGLSDLTETQAMSLALAYELPVPETKFARTSEEAAKIAKRIGFPVALKIASPHLTRKAEAGAVALNLADAAAVRHAFLDLTAHLARTREDVHVSGCMVQAMAPKDSRAVALWVRRDQQFGPLMTFGLAGPYSEVLRDVTHRLAPLTVGDAQEMIREIKTFPLLRGVRGQKPVALRALEDILLTVSQIAVDFPEIAEIELNPILVNEEGAVAADVKIAVA
jgi:acetyltransferase